MVSINDIEITSFSKDTKPAKKSTDISFDKENIKLHVSSVKEVLILTQ
jgi:hypothetical protein